MQLHGCVDDVTARICYPNREEFPREKTLAEIRAMKLIKGRVDVPIPSLYHYTMSSPGLRNWSI
jgi:hypothetical protein